MARVAMKLLQLLGVLSTVSAQYTSTDYADPFEDYSVAPEYYGGSGSGSGSGFGDPTLVDHEDGDDFDLYELPIHDPTDVDVCTGSYPEGMIR